MLIPTHIISPFIDGNYVLPVQRAMSPTEEDLLTNNNFDSVVWIEGSFASKGVRLKTSYNYDLDVSDVVEEWNSAFSKAPIQYTDKGKVCD